MKKKHSSHGDEHDAYVRREKPQPIDFGLFGAPDPATMPPDDDPTHGERDVSALPPPLAEAERAGAPIVGRNTWPHEPAVDGTKYERVRPGDRDFEPDGDSECPVDDPGCLSRDGECHDACEPRTVPRGWRCRGCGCTGNHANGCENGTERDRAAWREIDAYGDALDVAAVRARSRLPIEYVDSPPTAPGHDGASTSARAAAAIQSSGRYATSLALVHACVKSAGTRGATAQEIVDETAMLWPTVTSALRKLYLRGWIGWNDGHERASSASGLMQRVYVDEAFVAKWTTEQSRPPKPYAAESARRASGT